MKKIIYLIIPIYIFSCTKIHPNVIGEGTSLLNDNRKVNALFLEKKKPLDRFYIQIANDYGNPILDSNYQVYKFYNRNWSRDTIIMRIEQGLLINLDKTESNEMFISVETVNHKDLLVPKTQNQKTILNYFTEL